MKRRKVKSERPRIKLGIGKAVERGENEESSNVEDYGYHKEAEEILDSFNGS